MTILKSVLYLNLSVIKAVILSGIQENLTAEHMCKSQAEWTDPVHWGEEEAADTSWRHTR